MQKTGHIRRSQGPKVTNIITQVVKQHAYHLMPYFSLTKNDHHTPRLTLIVITNLFNETKKDQNVRNRSYA